MKIGIISDLHLWFDPKWDFTPEEGVYYICAGDITEDRSERNAFIQRHEGHMFTVLGNHDYYRESFWIGPGHSVEIGGIKIAGATLWTEMKHPLDFIMYRNGLYDCTQINFLSEAAYNEAHRLQKEYLLTSNADIIVSHHAPSYKSIHPKYHGDGLNHCFVSDLENDILNMHKPPKLWIFGHIHDPCWYYINDTLFIANPKGYSHEPNFKNYVPYILDLNNLPSKEEVEMTKWSPPFKSS